MGKRERTRGGYADEGRHASPLRAWGKLEYNGAGRSSESSDEEVMPMERFLLEIIAAVVAGVIVALISRKLK